MSGYGARSPRWSARSDSTSAPPAPTWAASAAKYRSRSAGIGAHGDRLLGLVHHEGLPAPGLQAGQRVQRVCARAWSRAPASLPGPATATTPARTSEDLPMPDGPTTARTPVSRSRRRHAATSSSRPKNESASSASYGSSPR